MPQTPPAPAAPPPQPTVTSVAPASSKKMVIVAAGIILVALLAAGIYLLMTKKQPATTQAPVKKTAVQATPKPPETVDALDKDLSTLNVGDIESDFSSVDQDLQSL